ncbi:MAG: hypothetical protein E7H79_10115 [Clostridium perfringens]|nr:hypothetical protein [Clostridium perfringens]
MDFLTATILSGVVYDQIKKGGEITGKYIKERLRGWIVSDKESENIAKKINEIDEPYKKNGKFLTIAIEDDEELMNILKNIKSECKYDQNNSYSVNTGNFVNGSGNSTGNITYGTKA